MDHVSTQLNRSLFGYASFALPFLFTQERTASGSNRQCFPSLKPGNNPMRASSWTLLTLIPIAVAICLSLQRRQEISVEDVGLSFKIIENSCMKFARSRCRQTR